MATTMEELEVRVIALEKLVEQLKLVKLARILTDTGKKKAQSSKPRKELTVAEKKAVRERLLKGQRDAVANREAEAAKKVTKPVKSVVVKK